MGDNRTEPKESTKAPGHEKRGGLIGAAVDLALAGVGAAVLLREEAQVLYRRSLERGQADVKQLQARPRPARMPQQASAPARSRPSRRAISASEEWRAALEHLNLPSATQVKVLTQQVADLEARIDELVGASERRHGVVDRAAK